MQYVQRSDCRAADLVVFRRRKAFLLCKNPCGRDCGGDGVPAAVGRGTARAKKFPEEICFAPSRVCQICRTPTSSRSKVRNNARLGKSLYRAAPGCQRDRGPSVSGGVQRNPFQGVPLGNFVLTVDAVLLCAAKKNGVETTSLAGHCQSTPGACRHGRQQNAPRCRARQ